MPRIAKTLADQREKKAFEMFSREEVPTTPEVEAALEKLGGGKMNLARLYEIRRAAIAKTGFPERKPKERKPQSRRSS